MIQYPQALLTVGGARTGVAPVNLLDVQTVDGNTYHWSERPISTSSVISDPAGSIFKSSFGVGAAATVQKPPFDSKFWSVSFAEPQMASIISPTPGVMNINLAFCDSEDLIQLIWYSSDTFDHPWFGYTGITDYSGVTDWEFTVTIDDNVTAFDAPNGMTLYVNYFDGTQDGIRLWNYMTSGNNRSATFKLNFADLLDGWFGSNPLAVKPVEYIALNFSNVNMGTNQKYATYQYSYATITQISITAPNISYGTATSVPNGLQMTIDYDNLYNLDPGRVVDGIVGLGYGGFCTIYLGISHFFTIGWNATESRYCYSLQTLPFNAPALAWLQQLYSLLNANGSSLSVRMSFEMLTSMAPTGWSQVDWKGVLSQTGYTPPSTLLAWNNPDAMTHLKNSAAQALSLVASGDTPYFQIGEPNWWDGSNVGNGPCFYDSYTQALYQAEYGVPMYTFTSLSDPVTDPNAIQTANFLAKNLGVWTQTWAASIKALYPNAKVCVLYYAAFTISSKILGIVNFPLTEWVYPNFDFFQLEAYDTVMIGDFTDHEAEMTKMISELGYPRARVQSFGGNGDNPADGATIWPYIFTAINHVAAMGITNLAIWSWSEIVSNGLIVGPQNIYLPWLLSVPSFAFHRSLQTDVGSFVVQNISGDTLSRDLEKQLRMDAFEGAFFVYRLWQPDAEAAWLEVHGTLTVEDVSVDTAQLKGMQLLNPAQDDTPLEIYCETCQLNWAGKRCGSTQPTECLYSYQSCQSLNRIMVVQNNYEKNYGETTANTALKVINRRRKI